MHPAPQSFATANLERALRARVYTNALEATGRKVKGPLGSPPLSGMAATQVNSDQ